MFDGNTALHIAAQEGDAAMCKVLIQAGADPSAKNSLRIKNKTEIEDSRDESDAEEEDEDDDEENDNNGDIEDPDCYTPLDYAADNIEVAT